MREDELLRWVGQRAVAPDIPPAATLSDLSTGVHLVLLSESITGSAIARFSRKPKHRMQSLENITLALSSLSKPGTSDIERALAGCSAAAIADGDLQLIKRAVVLVVARAQCDAGFSKRALFEWLGVPSDLSASLRSHLFAQEAFFAITNISARSSHPPPNDPKAAYEVIPFNFLCYFY
jgi:hypothetical protein